MTLKQIATFDVNRIRCGCRRALTTPIRNPLLKVRAEAE